MILWIALLSAFGCAICNGIAAVFQKIGADKQEKATSLQTGLLIKLLQDWPYLLGIALDGLAWILTLIAVHSLPLFVVQPIVAFGVVVTAVFESVLFHKKMRRQTIIAIGCITFGLILLATTAKAETAAHVSHTLRMAVIIAPLLLAAIGAIFVKFVSHAATIVLAAVSGLAFGGTAIVGRILHFSAPYTHVFISPLFAALVGYGLIGILLFTVALQRHHASVVNAVMITFEALAPIVIGLLFLGDSPRQGFWLPMIIGGCIAVTGTLLIAAKDLAKLEAKH